MALITCPECGKQVSDSAISCPNCGYGIAALKDRNIVKIKISLCSNTSCAKDPIRIVDPMNTKHVYAEVRQGEIATFEIKKDIEVGFSPSWSFGIKFRRIVSPGKKYQLIWGGNSFLAGSPTISGCPEVDSFSDSKSGETPPKTSWFVSW